ncbi:hydrolase [Actinoplanes sp. SE50]|nr:hydrolase [Actinoplanes sp. SE50/110]ATO82644.1 hydrolase [Actinoplanes sp. SE50]SLM00051.1 hypothetical protein ACSP50_3283 [Actinoplanes sp. SE50/110]
MEDGTRLVARRIGRGEPVVLVHGSAGGLDSWDPVHPLLSDRFAVWVYARRGYAPSDRAGGPKTYADDVADLRAVIAAAGGSAHVVGASYGATVGLHAAAGDAMGVRSLALFEPPLFAAGAGLAATLDLYRKLLRDGDPAAAAVLFAEQVSRVPAPILAALAGAAPPDPAEMVGCLHDLEAMVDDTLDVGRWGGTGVPVLLLQGSDTWAPMPETMEALAATLPDVTRVTLAGQSHFATHTAPRMVAGALLDFLG